MNRKKVKISDLKIGLVIEDRGELGKFKDYPFIMITAFDDDGFHYIRSDKENDFSIVCGGFYYTSDKKNIFESLYHTNFNSLNSCLHLEGY